jgi:hypothetical protein
VVLSGAVSSGGASISRSCSGGAAVRGQRRPCGPRAPWAGFERWRTAGSPPLPASPRTAFVICITTSGVSIPRRQGSVAAPSGPPPLSREIASSNSVHNFCLHGCSVLIDFYVLGFQFLKILSIHGDGQMVVC